MSHASLTSIQGIGTAPVADLAPVGFDAADMPEYLEVTQEISRIALDGVRAVDWNRVVVSAEVIVRERSKNLRIAAYLAYGLYETHGLKGLGVGFGVLADMCDAFWTDLHPPLRRLRGRVLALEWLVERVLAALERGGAEVDASDCEFALTQLERLATCLAERCPDAGDAVRKVIPVLRARREAVVRVADARRQLHEASMSRAASPSSPAARADEANGVHADNRPATRNSRDRALRELGRSMLEVASGIRTADVADVRAYTLQRTSIWLPVCELPPSIDGRTELPPPAGEVRGAIESAMTGRDYAGALAKCEDAATDSLFWLDAHRITAEALVSMGYESAARAVRAETGALLDRLPGLGDLNFKDGTPFADPATRQWLGLAVDRTGGQESRPASGGNG